MNKQFSIAGEHAPATGFSSTTAPAQACGASRTSVRWNDPIAWVAKKLWPRDTPYHFATYVGCKVRTAEYILSPTARRKTMDVKFVVQMFTGVHGKEFLKAWMDQSDAEWWQRMVELEKKQAEQERLLTALREAIKP
jgi:hypothetical protein